MIFIPLVWLSGALYTSQGHAICDPHENISALSHLKGNELACSLQPLSETALARSFPLSGHGHAEDPDTMGLRAR